jgi:hypothetical protein
MTPLPVISHCQIGSLLSDDEPIEDLRNQQAAMFAIVPVNRELPPLFSSCLVFSDVTIKLPSLNFARIHESTI